jgi:predicted restriction endonuclease
METPRSGEELKNGRLALKWRNLMLSDMLIGRIFDIKSISEQDIIVVGEFSKNNLNTEVYKFRSNTYIIVTDSIVRQIVDCDSFVRWACNALNN